MDEVYLNFLGKILATLAQLDFETRGWMDKGLKGVEWSADKKHGV